MLKEKTGDDTDDVPISVNAGIIWFDGDNSATPANGARIRVATAGSGRAISVLN